MTAAASEGSARRSRTPSSTFEDRYDGAVRPFAAPAGEDPAVWSAWRVRLRERLEERLGIEGPPPAAHSVCLDDAAMPGYRRLRMLVGDRDDAPMPVWLLIPGGAVTPGPAVIAVHGHGSGANEIVGLRPDGTPRSLPAGYQHDFALRLVERGFVVAVPEMLAFGRRREPADIAFGDDQNSCRTLATWAIELGTTLIGQRSLDLRRVVDLLAGRPEVNPARLGIFGISGGATASLFASILDERLAVSVLSGYVSSFRSSVLAMEHCICNLVPGIVADLEMADLALAIAPRALLLEAGRRDPIFPLAAALDAAERIKDGYARLGAPDRFELDVFDGEHEVSGLRAAAFLHEQLGVSSTGAGEDGVRSRS
jgi:dienelactone hydrolase